MVSFFVKKCTFNPEFANVPLALDCWNFTCLSLWHRVDYLCKKFSPTTYHLATIHPLQTTDWCQ